MNFMGGTLMEEQLSELITESSQGIGYSELTINGNNNNVICQIGINIASDVFINSSVDFAYSSIVNIANILYKSDQELTQEIFINAFTDALKDAVNTSAKTGFIDLLKEFMKVDDVGATVVEISGGMFYDVTIEAWKHINGDTDADELIENISKNALEDVLGGMTGIMFNYGKKICTDVMGIGISIGTMLGSCVGAISGAVMSTVAVKTLKHFIVKAAQKDAYERFHENVNMFYLEQAERKNMIPLKILDDIEEFQGIRGISLKRLIPMYSIITDFEEYKLRNSVLKGMENRLKREMYNLDYKTMLTKQQLYLEYEKEAKQAQYRYEEAIEQLKYEFGNRVRVGIESQYKSYLEALNYINNNMEETHKQLCETWQRGHSLERELEKRREVNQKFISLLKDIDLSEETDQAKEIVNRLLNDLKNGEFVVAVTPKEVYSMLRS